MFRLIPVSFILLLSFSVMGQQLIHLQGTIRGHVSGERLSYAFVSIKNTDKGAVADDQGWFSFSAMTSLLDTISFSMLGHQTKHIPVSQFRNSDTLNIFLEKNQYPLPQIEIEGMTARAAVKRAIDHLYRYFPDTVYGLKGYYRQVHRENNRYVRLIEACIKLKEHPMQDYSTAFQNEKASVALLRRSDNSEQNKEQHGDHLMDLLNENPVKYPVGTILNPKGFDYFTYQYRDDFTPGQMEIEYHSKPGTADKTVRGTLVLEDSTFLILRLDIHTYPNPNSRDRQIAPGGQPYLWKFQNGFYSITFRLSSGINLPAYIEKSYTHFLYDVHVRSLAYIVDEKFELWLQPSPLAQSESNKYSSKSNLYSQKYNYNEKDWTSFPVLPELIRMEFETKTELSIQFKRNGQ